MYFNNCKMNEKINTYEPEINPQKKLDIESPNSDFDDIMKDGLIHTKLNQSVIIQRIAKDLYNNPNSGLRELFMNSVRACMIANKIEDGMAEAYIEITIDKANRTLSIHDINATGISLERFKKVLLVLGTSDNHDGKTTGQFGMGFAAYMTLSSAMTLETKSRVKNSKGEYHNYKMIAKDAASFQPVGKSSLETFGTKLTMVLYEDVKIDPLLDMLRKLVRFCGVKTVLKLKNYESEDYTSQYDSGESETIYKSKTILETMTNKLEGKSGKVIHIDNENYEFVGLVGGSYLRGYYDNLNEVLLVGTPIISGITFPFDQWILNIKDERKYAPMPDRDRLKEETDKQLHKIMTDELMEHFSQVSISNYQELNKSDFKHEFLWLCSNSGHDWTPASMLPIIEKLQFSVKAPGKNGQSNSISNLMSEHDKIVYMNNNSKTVVKKIESLYEDENVYCFTFKKGKKFTTWEGNMEFLMAFGVPNSTQIFKENRIKIIHEKKELGDLEVIVHTNNGNGYTKSTLDVEAINDTTMMIDEGDTNKIISVIRKSPYCPFNVVRYIKELSATDVRLWSEYIEELPDIVVATNKGAMTISELSDTIPKKYECGDYNEQFEMLMTRVDELVILDKQQFFAYRIYQDMHEKPMPEKLDMNSSIGKVCGTGLYDLHHQKFFNKHYESLPKCHWGMFAKLIDDVDSYNYKFTDDESGSLTTALEQKLEIVKGFKRFDVSTPYLQVKGIEMVMATLKNDSNEWYKIDDLLREKISIITKNDYVFLKSIKKLVLPKIFDDFEILYWKLKEHSYKSSRNVTVTVKSLDNTITAREQFVVYSWEVNMKITKIVRDGKYNTVSLEMKLR